MSRTIHPRELGITLHCDAPGCAAKYVVAIIRVRPTRAAAARDGWSRYVRPGGATDRRADLCPEHKDAKPRWLEEPAEATG